MQIRGIASDVDSGQNAHPKELCGHLSELTFLHAFEGDLKFETMLKLAHPPDHGEFWRKHKLPKILKVLNLLTTEMSVTIFSSRLMLWMSMCVYVQVYVRVLIDNNISSMNFKVHA